MAAGEGIRGMVLDLAHRPLSGPNAQGYLFNIGLGFDLCIEKLNQGIHGRFIDDCDESFLPFIGADRGVPKGLTEDTASYRLRLKRAIDDYQRAGNAWAVLSQVLGYLLAKTPAARTVLTYYDPATGAPELSDWQTYAAGASLSLPPQASRDLTGEWNWDELSPTTGSWGAWRWYLVIESVSPNDWIGPSSWTIGDTGGWTIGDASEAVGFNRPALIIISIRIIVNKWKAGYSHWFVVTFDATEFRPGAAVNPDGHYAHGWKVTSRHHVASRSVNARYPVGVR